MGSSMEKNVEKRAVLWLSVELTRFRQATSGNQEAFCLIMEQLQGQDWMKMLSVQICSIHQVPCFLVKNKSSNTLNPLKSSKNAKSGVIFFLKKKTIKELVYMFHVFIQILLI